MSPVVSGPLPLLLPCLGWDLLVFMATCYQAAQDLSPNLYRGLLHAIQLHGIFNVFFPLSFPDSSVGKESACNAGDPGLNPGSEDALEKG